MLGRVVLAAEAAVVVEDAVGASEGDVEDAVLADAQDAKMTLKTESGSTTYTMNSPVEGVQEDLAILSTPTTVSEILIPGMGTHELNALENSKATQQNLASKSALEVRTAIPTYIPVYK